MKYGVRKIPYLSRFVSPAIKRSYPCKRVLQNDWKVEFHCFDSRKFEDNVITLKEMSHSYKVFSQKLKRIGAFEVDKMRNFDLPLFDEIFIPDIGFSCQSKILS